jgi:hypothetical protein
MAKLLYAIIAESTIVDSQSNLLSIIKIYENITVPRLPATIPAVFIITGWIKEGDITRPEHLNFRVRIVNPSGSEVERNFSMEGDIPANKRWLRTIIRAEAIPLVEAGLTKILIEKRNGTRWAEIGEIPFEVTQAPLQ